MFAKRLFQKATHGHRRHEKDFMSSDDVNFRINVHYGVPSTASILAFDPIQSLLAIGTLDGRIKVIGGDNVEGLLLSPKLLPYKYLEFIQNQGFLVSITNDNDIQVWNLERRSIVCSLQWESNITAFSVINGSSFMYVGDECGLISVLKYSSDLVELLQLEYQISSDSLAEAIGVSISNQWLIVGLLPQPCSSGNRLLIAYESGLIIIWDVAEAHAIVVRGNKVLQLKNSGITPNDAPSIDFNKEISALCWASTDGTMLAVGYMDGDILLWNTSKDLSINDQEAALSPNVVKLQLSSAEKRLPVIVLHWSDNSKSRNHQQGQLFIYGGDDTGCEEVVTVLSLEWSCGMDAVRCTSRVALTITGSFADMILIPSAGTTGSDTNVSLFVLSNPGQMHIYDRDGLCSTNLQSGMEHEQPISALKFLAGIPTLDPLMTVAGLFHVYGSIEAVGYEIAAVSPALTLPGNMKWPLTGGICNHLSFGKDSKFRRLYVAGYQDGSVRVWDATYPVFQLLCVLNKVYSEILVGVDASLTTIDLCSSTLRLAAGSEGGLVQLYELRSSDETSLHIVTETSSEVHGCAQTRGPRCSAVFNLQKPGVQALKFVNDGSKLIVGYACAQIAVVDVCSLSVGFIMDSVPSSPVISVTRESLTYRMEKTSNEYAANTPDSEAGELLFVLTMNSSVYAIDGKSGRMICSKPTPLKKKSTPISLHVIEIQQATCRPIDEQESPKGRNLRNELLQNVAQDIEQHETQEHCSDKKPSGKNLEDLFVLLCYSDSVRIYPIKSVIQGESKYIYKVKLPKPCCWTTVLKKDALVCGLVILYHTGELEIRSLPHLAAVKEFSLLSELRWNFKTIIGRMISSTENGHIVLVNGCEVAFISLLGGENGFRIPESLPSLHDEVLAAAASAAISVSSDPKRKEGRSTGVLQAIVKGFKGRKSNNGSDSKCSFSHLEDIFSRNPFLEPLDTANDQEADELSIDDIEIDEPVALASTSSHDVDYKNREKKSEREELFDDSDVNKPRVRTREEIIAKYRKAEDASSAAGEARNKLLERQEKLERISRRTEDLRNGAENFASLANELVKVMENRKWYHI